MDEDKSVLKLTTILESCRMNPEWKQLTFRNFHALRHTHATTLLASGLPIVDVSRVLGHAKVSTTLDIYGHAIPENLNAIADKILVHYLHKNKKYSFIFTRQTSKGGQYNGI